MVSKEETHTQPSDSDVDGSFKESPIELPQNGPNLDFPEGGFRAWSVAAGAGGILFCTFGYANAFGYALHSFVCSLHKLTLSSVFQEYYMSHQLSSESPSSISWIGSLQSK